MSGEIRVVVCLKQVLDPEAPASSFRIDADTNSITAQGVPPVISPYDQSALELAIRLKEGCPAVRISALSFGSGLSRPVLMKSLAVGADELYLIEDQAADTDGRMTAAVLAAAVRRIGFDLVLAGRQASDTNSGGVGPALAEILGVPAICWARNMELADGELTVERVSGEGIEIYKGPLPALVTVTHEAGELRMAKLPEIRKAKQKPIHTLSPEGLAPESPEPALSLLRLEKPARERHCRILEADSEEEAGDLLAKTLAGEGIICF